MKVFVAWCLLCLVAAVPRFRIDTSSDSCLDPFADISREIKGINEVLVENTQTENTIHVAQMLGEDAEEITRGEIASEPPELSNVNNELLATWNRLADVEERRLAAEVDLEEHSPRHLSKKVGVSHEIGRGGYKVVFKEKYDGVQRAIARIPASRYHEVKREWFYQEAVRAVLIGGLPVCKNFVPEVIGIFRDSGYVFIVSELAEGDIDTNARSKPRSAFERWEAIYAKDEVSQLVGLTQMAVGLKCVKAARLIHRDAKPANFLVSSDSTHRILINDFGLSTKMCRDAKKFPEGLPMCTSLDEPLSMDCCTSEDVAFITVHDHRHYHYWPDDRYVSSMGSDVDVFSLGISITDMMDESPRVFGFRRHALSDLAEEMTSNYPPSIDSVILELLRMLKSHKNTQLSASLGKLLELQQSMYSYLADLEDLVTKDSAKWSSEIHEKREYLALKKREADEELAEWEAVQLERANYEAAPRIIRWCLPRPQPLGPKPVYEPDEHALERIEELEKKIGKRMLDVQDLKELIKESMA